MFISPMRAAIDAGLRPTNHTDFVVAPLDQMTMLWSAMNRISRAGSEIGPDQRVTPYEGLKCMTEWAAEQYDEQDQKGTLEVGERTFVIWRKSIKRPARSGPWCLWPDKPSP